MKAGAHGESSRVWYISLSHGWAIFGLLGFNHTNLNQDIFETAYFFLHESAIRQHENKSGSTKTRIVMKPLSKAVLSPRPQKRKNTCGLIFQKCPNSCVHGL